MTLGQLLHWQTLALKVVYGHFGSGTGKSRFKEPIFSFLNRLIFDLRNVYVLNLNCGKQKKCLAMWLSNVVLAETLRRPPVTLFSTLQGVSGRKFSRDLSKNTSKYPVGGLRGGSPDNFCWENIAGPHGM